METRRAARFITIVLVMTILYLIVMGLLAGMQTNEVFIVPPLGFEYLGPGILIGTLMAFLLELGVEISSGPKGELSQPPAEDIGPPR